MHTIQWTWLTYKCLEITYVHTESFELNQATRVLPSSPELDVFYAGTPWFMGQLCFKSHRGWNCINEK